MKWGRMVLSINKIIIIKLELAAVRVTTPHALVGGEDVAAVRVQIHFHGHVLLWRENRETRETRETQENSVYKKAPNLGSASTAAVMFCGTTITLRQDTTQHGTRPDTTREREREIEKER